LALLSAKVDAGAEPEDGPFIRPPSHFVRVLRDSEAAADALQKGPAKAVCAALRLGDSAKLEAALTPDFRGRLPGEAAPVETGGDASIAWRRRGPDDRVLSGRPFVAALRALVAPLTVVERCSLKPIRFKLNIDERSAYAELGLSVAGRDGGGRGVELTGMARVETRVEAKKQRFRRFELRGLESVATHTLFRDISAAAGVGLHRDALTRARVELHTNEQTLETIGGLAVVDWEGDGDDDLLAWNQLTTLQVFVNDGRGGFDKQVNPIDPAAVGFFQLLVDLDGDGAPELVSTEVEGCEGGQARLHLFTRRGGRFVPRPGRLAFEQPCVRIDRLHYQHIAAHDIDGDGDLDLFASGYKNHLSKARDHNLFHARDGQRDLLFLNEGGLRFREVARERGIVGQSFGYGGVFFDADADGDDDLLVVNDYGPNNLWLNDGAARFVAGTGALAANGQSMGVTVTDLDGDAVLDVYVSNMFSKAGNRIVPLVASKVSPETYASLLALAQGNSLFRRGPDGFTDVAAQQGAARAGWAWGHTAFDADNDGDRDLYVVNGMTSHTDAAAPDF